MKQAPLEDWTEALGSEDDARQLWSALEPVAAAAPAGAEVNVDAAWAEFRRRVDASGEAAAAPGAKIVRLREGAPRSRRYWRAAAAAAAVLAILIGVNVLAGLGDTVVQYANASTDEMPVRLPDDSEAMLMPGSQLHYEERDGRREVTIAGEVGFDVAPRADMSFAVSAEELEIVVVGTEFMVNHDGRKGVDVTEGHVRIRGRREADWTDVYAGGFARVEDGMVVKARPRDVVGGGLRFDEAPIATILAALADAHGVPFTAEAALRACAVTVNLAGASPTEAAVTLSTVLGAEAVERDGGFHLRGARCQ